MVIRAINDILARVLELHVKEALQIEFLEFQILKNTCMEEIVSMNALLSIRSMMMDSLVNKTGETFVPFIFLFFFLIFF
jgi:hypothetical protein